MHVKFPSIEALRNVCFKIGRMIGSDAPAPTLVFKGTPKLHGTNAGIVLSSDGVLTYQSRDRQLSVADDLFGFMAYMQGRERVVQSLFRQYAEHVMRLLPNQVPTYIAVFGEWAGGSIQKRDIAVRGMEKIWAIVGVRLYYGDPKSEDCKTLWLDNEDIMRINAPDDRIFNIGQFGSYYVSIDFGQPVESFEKLITHVTAEVDAKCPVGAFFGLVGHGEGYVWQCVTQGWTPNELSARYPNSSSYDLTFKSKGERHETSKKKEMDDVDPAYVEKIKLFVSYAVTENRMQQGLDKLTREVNQPLTQKLIGPFIKWVYNDVLKEEGDVAEANEINEQDLGKPIAEKAKTWFFKQLEAQQ